jgi:hypothetical protein
MRWDWIPLSASALVIGVMALVFGALLNPVPPGGDSAETMATVAMAGGRWLGMSVMYFLASVTLTLGLPAILSLFTRRARRIGVVAVVVFAVGVIGTSGYAMLLVFFRALVKQGAIRSGGLEQVTNDVGLGIFLYGWIAGFYIGLLLLAIALFVARRTPVWVPILLLGFVAVFPVTEYIGRVGQVAQVMALAFAFTGIAMAAVHPEDSRAGASTQPAY